ncbi:MAG: Long-chain-fatty-acid--CoA ligase [Alphaproteobacteria bacterium MarineAlpha3_Bin5]|nr:acyl-CoA synthetase [Magnetovibrio sp.]PPR77221.1 MAG: Long-chain-fatty-acid--CoA ligase [Alphaproteobacteria bacterium MarineAlpha3_Bin5]
MSIYETDLDKSLANFTSLSPISFLERTAKIYPNHTSIIHGNRKFSWKETYERAKQLASALLKSGIRTGDTVAVMASNTPEMYECAFGPAMIGAVVNMLNNRLDSKTIAFSLDHGEAKILIADIEFSKIIKPALSELNRDIKVIDIRDSEYYGPGDQISDVDYETFLASGDLHFKWQLPKDEWQAISLNYTSGTTGNPKGVVYHHRGAYLNSLSNIISWNMTHHPIYLWTLPMFHCNGWCFPWTIAALAGTNICLRRVNAETIFEAIATHKVTHFCGAPIILNLIINATQIEKKDFKHRVNVMTAAAPPPASTLESMQREGFHVTHVYGLTETYGPAVVCAWHHEWDDLSIEEQATLKSRQGVKYPMLEKLTILNPDSMEPVPSNSQTIGEVMFRGNIVMKGYLKNPTATKKALSDGWLHSGDLGVIQSDGYIQLKDRSKDIIISGGENISSIEIEDVLYRHPDIQGAAVVAKPDEKWGESPCAFIEIRENTNLTEDQIIQFCRKNMAHFKCPKSVVFGELPKTSTGKIQKYKLRKRLENSTT